MKRETKVVMVAVTAINLNLDRNYREDYDLPILISQIVAKGRVLEPLHIEKECMEPLKGFRRLSACKWIQEHPADYSAEIVKNTETVPVIFYTELTAQEREDMIFDQGESKGLSNVETVKAVWRMQARGEDFLTIGRKSYQQLARFTGNTEKLAEVKGMPDGRARDEKLKTWLKGTLYDIMMVAGRMGELVREQYILQHRTKDRPLTEEEKKRVIFKCNNKRVQDLARGMAADQDAKKWDFTSSTGPEFEGKIASFVKEDAAPANKKRTFTPSQMKSTGEAMQSEGLRLAFLKCAGETKDGDDDRYVSLDAEYLRRDKVFVALIQYRDRVTDPAVRSLIGSILHDGPEKVVEQLNGFIPLENRVANVA
jgi:hypothetical protein